MEFRRSGSGSERRRRMRIEEPSSPSGTPVEGAAGRAAGGGHALSYCEAARADRQARIIELFPTRYFTLVSLFLLGLAIIAGLESLHACRDQWSHTIPLNDLAALDLAGAGNLAAWYSSSTLALAALTAVLIYAIRRHKLDDYRGRYRVWLWAATFWLLASVDATAGWHTAVRGVLVHLAGTGLYGDGSIWWIGLWSVVLGLVGIALLVDMRHCRASSAALLLAATLYAVSASMRLGFIRLGVDILNVMVVSSAHLTAHVLLLFSMALYARHVFLDAQGMLPVRTAKPQKMRPRRQQSQSSEKTPKATANANRSPRAHSRHGRSGDRKPHDRVDFVGHHHQADATGLAASKLRVVPPGTTTRLARS